MIPLSFKQWLLQQNDAVNEDNAAEMFVAYKSSFARKVLQEYFDEAQGQQWFREKYHPVQAAERNKELQATAEHRLAAFLRLHKLGKFNVELASDNITKVHHIMEEVNEALNDDDVDPNAPPLPPLPPPPPPEGTHATPTKMGIDSHEFCKRKQRHTVFLHFIPHTITRAQVRAVLQKVPGFRRLALSVPTEKTNKRLGWAVFSSTSDMSEVRKELDGTMVGDERLRVSSHDTDVTRLVGVVNSMSIDQDVIGDRLLLHALIATMDKERGLFQEEPNPLLANTITNDELIWYLRIVHSYDFYAAVEHHFEDDMPIRVSIIHVARPASGHDATPRSAEWIAKTKARGETKQFTESELAAFGLKDEDAEVEAFILKNIVKTDDIFLCPLSGKLFKTEEFVRKHILSKQTDKLDEVRQNAQFYNNFARDPRRKFLPLREGALAAPVQSMPGVGIVKDAFGRDIQLRHMTGDISTINAPVLMPPPPQVYPTFSGRAHMPRPQPSERGLITYKDLDAPTGPSFSY